MANILIDTNAIKESIDFAVAFKRAESALMEWIDVAIPSGISKEFDGSICLLTVRDKHKGGKLYQAYVHLIRFDEVKHPTTVEYMIDGSITSLVHTKLDAVLELTSLIIFNKSTKSWVKNLTKITEERGHNLLEEE